MRTDKRRDGRTEDGQRRRDGHDETDGDTTDDDDDGTDRRTEDDDGDGTGKTGQEPSTSTKHQVPAPSLGTKYKHIHICFQSFKYNTGTMILMSK